eukprot:4678265-Amphidinium_carterae.2
MSGAKGLDQFCLPGHDPHWPPGMGGSLLGSIALLETDNAKHFKASFARTTTLKRKQDQKAHRQRAIIVTRMVRQQE